MKRFTQRDDGYVLHIGRDEAEVIDFLFNDVDLDTIGCEEWYQCVTNCLDIGTYDIYLSPEMYRRMKYYLQKRKEDALRELNVCVEKSICGLVFDNEVDRLKILAQFNK